MATEKLSEATLPEVLEELSLRKVPTHTLDNFAEPGLNKNKKEVGDESESKMYEDTRFSEAEGEKLMCALIKMVSAYSNDAEKPDIDLNLFQKIMKNLNVSHFFAVDKVFNALDTNEDSKISPSELISGLSTILRGSFEEQVDFGFRIYDISKREFLTLEDVTTCVMDSLTPMSVVSWERKPKTMSYENAKALADLIFPKLDSDGDGMISFNDFRSACVADPTLLESLGSFLPKDASCHNSHRVTSPHEPVSNISNRLESLKKTSTMARLFTPQNVQANRPSLKPIELKLRK